MPSEILGAGAVPPIKYIVYDEGRLLGECPGITVGGTGVVTLVLKKFTWAPGVEAGPELGPDEIVAGMKPSLDMFDKLRHELKERGWQPDVAEEIAADAARTYINNIMKKATE